MGSLKGNWIGCSMGRPPTTLIGKEESGSDIEREDNQELLLQM